MSDPVPETMPPRVESNAPVRVSAWSLVIAPLRSKPPAVADQVWAPAVASALLIVCVCVSSLARAKATELPWSVSSPPTMTKAPARLLNVRELIDQSPTESAPSFSMPVKIRSAVPSLTGASLGCQFWLSDQRDWLGCPPSHRNVAADKEPLAPATPNTTIARARQRALTTDPAKPRSREARGGK